MKTKKFLTEIKSKVLDLKDRIKKVNETEKKSADEALKIIEEIIDCNKGAQKAFAIAWKVDKGKSEPKIEESIAKRVTLRREKITEIEREEKNINNELSKEYFTNYRSPSDMYKKLRKREGEINENRVYLIKEVLNRMKKVIKNVPENKKIMIEENEKVIDIVERIFYFNQLDQSGQGFKILTRNQMLSRLPISLAQLKAGNNSEKLKNEIRQLLYSLHISKNLQSNAIKVWLTLFKNGNNLYEH